MKYLKIRELAEVSGLPFSFVYKLIREKKLKAVMSGKAFYSSEEWLKSALEKMAE